MKPNSEVDRSQFGYLISKFIHFPRLYIQFPASYSSQARAKGTYFALPFAYPQLCTEQELGSTTHIIFV